MILGKCGLEDSVLEEYLSLAEEEIVNYIYSMTGTAGVAVKLPHEYEQVQIWAVVYGINQRGAEGELALEFHAHYHHTDLDGKLWNVAEADAIGDPVFVSAVTFNSTKILVTFNAPLDSTTLAYGDFTVMMSDTSKAISAAALKPNDSKVVELTVATLTAGKTITVRYTKGTLKGTNGVAVNTFSTKPVTNTLSS